MTVIKKILYKELATKNGYLIGKVVFDHGPNNPIYNNCIYFIILGARLDSYIQSVTQHSRRGVSLETKNIPNWSFGQSFFFSGTVVTTIGI